MTVRRIDWGAPTRELVTRLVELAQGWVDGDYRAQAMADGLIAKIREERAPAEDRSKPPDGLEVAEHQDYIRYWCRTEDRDTEAEAIADGWAVVDRARGGKP